MKLVRYEYEGNRYCGILELDEIRELKDDFLSSLAQSGKRHALSEVKLLAPCAPSKIVAVGLNYRAHAKELELALPAEPVIFLKPPTALIGPDDEIVWPTMSSQVDYEAELGVVIRDRTREVTPAEAGSRILGYVCANDVTARDLQKKDGQWTRSKSFDTFCPVGPWIETGLNPDDVLIESYLNGERRQSGRTSQLIYSVRELVSFISKVMTLLPGDLILTGTPSGIGPMKRGDEIEVRIEGIGSLKNIVRAT